MSPVWTGWGHKCVFVTPCTLPQPSLTDWFLLLGDERRVDAGSGSALVLLAGPVEWAGKASSWRTCDLRMSWEAEMWEESPHGTAPEKRGRKGTAPSHCDRTCSHLWKKSDGTWGGTVSARHGNHTLIKLLKRKNFRTSDTILCFYFITPSLLQ